ncbi:hypothetical protein TorRG33x02_169520, partial [Trema orientale]
MVVVSPHKGILHHVIPQANRHVVRARDQQALPVRREFHLPHRVSMPIQHRDRDPEAPHIPHLNRFIHRPSNDTAVIVFVPITGEDLELVGRDNHGGTGLTHVPDADGAVPRGGGEHIPMTRVPDGAIHAVSVLLECPHAGGAVQGPELDGVVPRRGDEGIASDRVVIGGLDLAGVLVEGANWVGGRGQGEVVELDGAIGYGGNDEVVVGLGPGDIVHAVGGVVRGELGDGCWGGARRGGEFEDVEAAVADDAEVLGGGDGEAVLVEGAELDGVAVEWGFEDGHRVVLWLLKTTFGFLVSDFLGLLIHRNV